MYKENFLLIRQGSQEAFSDHQEVCHIYDCCKFKEEGRCCDHKDYAACKKSARDMRVTYILTLAV